MITRSISYRTTGIPESKLDNSDDKSAGAKYTEWAKAGLLTICEGYDIDTACVADWFAQLYKQYGFRLCLSAVMTLSFSKQFIKRMDEYGFDTEIVQQSKQVMFNALPTMRDRIPTPPDQL